MGGSTIANSETRIEALKLQSSAYGVTIAVVGGVPRIAGNLVWYGDFKATPHTSTQDAGGKGGGVKTQNTSFSYSASVVMALHQGLGGAVRRVWVGKQVYSGGWTPALVARAEETFTVPSSGAMTYTLAHGATIIGNPFITTTGSGWRVPLALGTAYKIDGGVITILNDIWRGMALVISYQWGNGAPDISPLDELGLTFTKGDLSQTAPAWLSSTHADQALGYPGLALVHGQAYQLGTGAQVENHTFEVQGAGAYRYGPSQPDCNPWEFGADVLSNGRYGARMPAATLEVQSAIDYCAAAGLLLSPALTEQIRAGDFVETMCKLTNCAPVWSVDRLRIVPYGDTTITGNGVTYTPNTTPLVDLTDDFFLQDGDDDPLHWELKEPSDRYNHVRVEYSDRANNYNKTIVEAKDDADVATNGLRTMQTISAPWVCDGAVARLVAQYALQRSLNITGTGTFRLPWAFYFLEPMDLVTLTDEGLGFDLLPARINEIGEDEEGMLDVAVEDWPLGSASATKYTAQVPGGFQHNYQAAPGSVSAPLFFEAPVERTTTGLEIYMAVKSTDPDWGGCNVWVSLDGSTYRKASTLYGPARYGTLSGAVASGVMPVNTSGQLISGTTVDASALETLCYVGGANPEYLAYTLATLTGVGAYNLGGLVRGAFGTSTAAHSTGDPFVRVGQDIGKSGPLDLSYIGKTVYFKFTSFNVYQLAEEELSAVTAYSYAITGTMAKLPPPNVSGMAYTVVQGGVRVSWADPGVGDWDVIDLRVGGTSWANATPLFRGKATGYSWLNPAQGGYTLRALHFDQLGNPSTAETTLTVTVDSTIVIGSISPVLSNTNHSVPADASGTVTSYGGASSTLSILLGATNDTSSWTITKTFTGCAGTGGDPSNAVTISNLSADVGYVDFTATRTGYPTQTARFTITKAKAGATGAAGAAGAAGSTGAAGATGATGAAGANGLSTALVYIFQRAASAPAVPSATVTFTFASGAISGLNNGWAATVPAGSNPLYVCVATASSTGSSDTIATGEWATPVIQAQDGAAGATGAAGANGLNSATVYLFQRTSTSTPPSVPSTSVTYTFSTGGATGINNGWAQTMPTTGGAYRWITQATALGTGSTDTLATGEWAAVSLLAQDGAAGAAGAAGSTGAAGATGATGADSTAYWLGRSAAAVSQGLAGGFTPAALTFSGYSATGTASPAAYSGRFIIATSPDGSTYTNHYTSSSNESSTSYTVPAGTKTIRARLYQAGGTTTLLDEEIVPVVQDGTGQFAPAKFWEFEAGWDGWSGSGLTGYGNPTSITLTSTSTDPIFASPSIAINGAVHPKIRARLRRLAGSGWEGIALYKIAAGHDFSASYYRQVADPTIGGAWTVIEWDMSALTVGGADWTSSTINQIRLDLGTTSSDIFEIDWVAIGKDSAAIQAGAVSTDQIAAGAATEVYRTFVAGPEYYSPGA